MVKLFCRAAGGIRAVSTLTLASTVARPAILCGGRRIKIGDWGSELFSA